MTEAVAEREYIGEQNSILINKYRPRTFDQVIGQPHVIGSLKSHFAQDKKNWSRTWFLVGKYGCGKTTTARLIANQFGVKTSGLLEIDAATTGKVDDIRALVEQMQYAPIDGDTKVVIMDECQRMTPEAWDGMLKSIEVVGPSACFIFCSTNDAKIPKTAKSRGLHYIFNEVSPVVLEQYASQVIMPLESITLPATEGESYPGQHAVQIIVEAADGSVRQLLSVLDKCRNVSDVAQLRTLVCAANTGDDAPLIQIAKLLTRNATDWVQYMALMDQMQPEDWGGMKKILSAWMSKVCSKSCSQQNAIMLDALDKLPEYPDKSNGPVALQLLLYRTVMKSSIRV